MLRPVRIHSLAIAFAMAFVIPVSAARYLENLNRGVVAISTSASSVFISWRLLGTESTSLGFNIYRNGTKLNASPITGATNYTDNAGSSSASYVIKAVANGTEIDASTAVTPWSTGLTKRIPLSQPAGGTTPDNVAYTYSPNDGSAGDLDGDGDWDLVLKWDPSNSKDNSQSGYTGNTYLDGMTLDGTRLWRIDLGKNIRAGAHYSPFVVADFDLDGKAEIICKTAPGTKDGTGNYLSKGPAASDDDSKDYRNSSGFITSGPEYLTIFRGSDGKELATVNYVPNRDPANGWGKSSETTNRVDRFLATAAWLDGNKPSAVMQRGYYGRMALAAWDWDGTTLAQRWYYNAATDGQECYGQGNHNLATGDVDDDGKDEILEGSCAIDHNGAFLYRTGLGHGDAMHFGDLDPNRDGLEVWEVHEETGAAYGYELHDARTGKIIWGAQTGTDNGRGLAADIDASSAGYEMWSASGSGTYSAKGTQISTSKPAINFRIYWDGDLQDEILDAIGSTPSAMKIDSWANGRLVSTDTRWGSYTGLTNNSTKANPVLVADLLGDWREEMILRESGDQALILYSTTTPTTYRLYTLMHDPIYRASISWQNSAYNQPPHLGFFLGNGTDKAPTPDIVLVGASSSSSSQIPSSSSSSVNTDCAGVQNGSAATDACGRCVAGTTGKTACGSVVQAEVFCSADGVFENSNGGFLGTGYMNFTNADTSFATYVVQSPTAQQTTAYVRSANGGTAARSLSVSVNSTALSGALSSPVGSWTTWDVAEFPISLVAGRNELVFRSVESSGGPNLDLIGFAASGIDSASCGGSTTPLVHRNPGESSFQLRFAGATVFLVGSFNTATIGLYHLDGTQAAEWRLSPGQSGISLEGHHGPYLLVAQSQTQLAYKYIVLH